MAGAGNPWDVPEWHAVGREAALVRHLIGSGATALGRANYADQTGEYYTAFFGLSVGLERLAKLILVVDHAISNDGQMPDEKIIRRFGHNLRDLIVAADSISMKRNLVLRYVRPNNEVSASIVACLDSFADASRGRYANFATLGDPNLGKDEPIKKWWGEVAELILRETYHGKPAQKRIEQRAKVIDDVLAPVTMVRHVNESGDVMRDLFTASVRTGQTELVQRYSRYHALTIVRWLSEVFSELARDASCTHNVHAFYGVWEYFWTYTVDDDFLKTRKRWPLG